MLVYVWKIIDMEGGNIQQYVGTSIREAIVVNAEYIGAKKEQEFIKKYRENKEKTENEHV